MPKRKEMNIELEKLLIEKERIHLEQERFLFDKKRNRDENRFRYATVFSFLVPLLVVAITIYFSISNQNKQTQSDFILRAAEVVTNSNSPAEAQNKLKALEYLFPNLLPKNFSDILSKFEATDYTEGPSYDNKMNFLNLMANSGASTDEILEMYKKLFPDSLIIQAVDK